jgi:NADH-quinone oxidoreductase subunit E
MSTVNLTASMILEIDECVKKFSKNRKQSTIIEVLHIVQKYNDGWLSLELLDAVADYLKLPRINVYEIATFYNMFEPKPVGKYKICVCSNLSCMLCGSKVVFNHLRNKLNINLGEITQDGKFSLQEIECMAECDKSPVISVNNQQYTNVTTKNIDDILVSLK